MSNLIAHARKELELINAFTEEGDFYGGMTGNAVMELVEVFSKQGHSGGSASLVRQLFNMVSNFKPLSPLTFDVDEWNESGDNTFQNNRNSAVLKQGAEGRPYYIDAYYMKSQTGSTFSGGLHVGDGRIVTKCFIKNGGKLPELCIDVIEKEVNKDTGAEEVGSGWWIHKMKDVTQLAELEKHYDLAFEQEV